MDDNNRPIIWETIDLLISKNFMGLKENFCYSVPSLGNLETYMSTKADVIKYFYPQWLDILGQTSKFTMIGVDNWCNIFDVPDFLSSVNDAFFITEMGYEIYWIDE